MRKRILQLSGVTTKTKVLTVNTTQKSVTFWRNCRNQSFIISS